jgi:3-deoxy-manno-octulosonate cytidylyltransferase (CMP-KDO synthetase)
VKVLGIIPARYASSRFPGKPLIDLKGKSMIQRVYEGASKSAKIDLLLVATDEQRIVDEVKRFGGNVEMTETSHCSGTDRCAEVAARHTDFDIVINIQGDEPLVDYRQLDLLIQSFEDESVKIATLATRKISIDDINNPNRIKIVLKENNTALYFSRSPIPNTTNTSQKDFPFLKHIGLYGFKMGTLISITKLPPTLIEKTESLEQLRWLFYNYPITIIQTDIETPNIDSPEDMHLVISLL